MKDIKLSSNFCAQIVLISCLNSFREESDFIINVIQEDCTMEQIEQANLVTIIGMIAAFITASVTPLITDGIKNFFQHRSKLSKLRIALYKEMLINYETLTAFSKEEEASLHPEYIAKHAIRDEFYNHALQNELSLFYELGEVDTISLLQGSIIGGIIDLTDDLKSAFPNKKISKGFPNAVFMALSYNFKSLFAAAFPNEILKSEVLKKITSKGRYEEIMRRGKKETDKAYTEF